jgi:hypothetical protein
LDGWCAILLWSYHQRGISGALETLLRYNLEDVVHLPTLLAVVYNARTRQLPFALEPMPLPLVPEVPFGFDEALIYRTLVDTGRAQNYSENTFVNEPSLQ